MFEKYRFIYLLVQHVLASCNIYFVTKQIKVRHTEQKEPQVHSNLYITTQTYCNHENVKVEISFLPSVREAMNERQVYLRE